MKKTSTITMARQLAYYAGSILGTYANSCFFSMALFMLMVLRLRQFYMTGYEKKLDFDTPIANFTNGELNFPFQNLNAFLFDAQKATLEEIRQRAYALFIGIVILGLYAFPQWSGCKLLRKAVQLGRDPRESYRFVHRHQIFQRLVCLIETVAMIAYCIRLLVWPELETNSAYVIIACMIFLILSRMRFLKVVERFEFEVFLEAASTEYKCKMGENLAEKLGEKKGNKKTGQGEIDFFNIV